MPDAGARRPCAWGPRQRRQCGERPRRPGGGGCGAGRWARRARWARRERWACAAGRPSRVACVGHAYGSCWEGGDGEVRERERARENGREGRPSAYSWGGSEIHGWCMRRRALCTRPRSGWEWAGGERPALLRRGAAGSSSEPGCGRSGARAMLVGALGGGGRPRALNSTVAPQALSVGQHAATQGWGSTRGETVCSSVALRYGSRDSFMARVSPCESWSV